MPKTAEMTKRAKTDGSLAAELRFCVTRLSRILRQQDQSGLSPTLLAALATVLHEGPLTLGDLARKEQVSPPTITNAVNKLEVQGLVRRRIDAEDKRRSLIEVTADGKRRVEAVRSAKTAWLEGQLSELSKDDLARLTDSVSILVQLTEGPRSLDNDKD